MRLFVLMAHMVSSCRAARETFRRLHACTFIAVLLPSPSCVHHLAAQSPFLANLSVDLFVLWQLKEIKNARLAMLAFGGIFHQQLLTKTGALAYLAGSK
jgi:hypothetical protein